MGRTQGEPKDIIEYIKLLEKRIQNLERSQRIGNTSIDGGSVVVNNGAIVAKHPNGVELFRTGTGSTILPFEVNPTQGYVTSIRRANGNLIFEAFSSEGGGESMSQLRDRNSNQILTEDYLTGNGLGRPFIPYRIYKASEWLTPPDIVTSGTFAGVYIIESNQQHPAVYVNVRVVADAGTAGEVRLQDTFFGNTMWSATITTAFNGNLEGSGNITGFRAYGNNTSFEVQARRTAGTGNIRLLLVMAYGRSANTI